MRRPRRWRRARDQAATPGAVDASSGPGQVGRFEYAVLGELQAEPLYAACVERAEARLAYLLAEDLDVHADEALQRLVFRVELLESMRLWVLDDDGMAILDETLARCTAALADGHGADPADVAIVSDRAAALGALRDEIAAEIATR